MTTKTMLLTIGMTMLLLLFGTASAAAASQHPKDFTREEVVDFLRSTFGTGDRGSKVVASFEENDALDGATLDSLTTEDLTKDLGLSNLQAKKFRSAVDELLQDTIAVQEKETPSTDVAILKGEKAPSEEGIQAEDDEKSVETTKKVGTTVATTTTNSKFYNHKWQSYCDNLCSEQNEIYQHVPLEFDAKAFRDAVLEWSIHPENSPYGPIVGCWDVSHVTDFSSAFQNFRAFDEDLRCWDTSSAITMDRMFHNAIRFNQPLDSWNVSKVTSMKQLFSGAKSFSKPIGEWDVSSVTDTSGMFFDAASFDQPLDDWDVSNVNNMAFMFAAATKFNQPLRNWTPTKVEDFESMFDYALRFDQPLGNWKIESAYNLNRMFTGALHFNQDLCGWKQYLGKESEEAEQESSGRKKRRARKATTTTKKNYFANTYQMFEGTSCKYNTGNLCHRCA